MTHVEGTVTGPGGQRATVLFLMDSGATYTLLPHPIWQALGLGATRTMAFSLADGTVIERRVSECHISLPQGEGHTPVILGEPGDEALLGTVTLEILGLVLNPFTRQLQPTRLMLSRHHLSALRVMRALTATGAFWSQASLCRPVSRRVVQGNVCDGVSDP